MSESKKNHSLVLLGIITSIFTICGTMLQVGSLKGELISKVNDHKERLDHHEAKLDHLNSDVNDIKARIHGIASQVGKIPVKVATALRPQNNEQLNQD